MRLFAWFIFSSTLIAATSCNDGHGKTDTGQPAAALKDSANFTTITWLDSTKKDFGKITEGQKLEVAFRFKNSGDKPLVITKVQPSCGCTVAEQPNEPVAAGREGIIKATFDSRGRTGTNHKNLFVFSNTKVNTETALQFDVEVEKQQ